MGEKDGEMTWTLIMSYTQHVCPPGGMSDSCYSLTILQNQTATFQSRSAAFKVISKYTNSHFAFSLCYSAHAMFLSMGKCTN